MTNQSRKQRLAGDDAFIHAADEASLWLGKHRTLAIGGLIAVVLLIAAAFLAQNIGHRRDVRAAALFAEGFKALDGRVVDPAEVTASAEAKGAAGGKADAKATGKGADRGAERRKNSESSATDASDDADDSAADADDSDSTRLQFPTQQARWSAAHAAFAQTEATRGHTGIGALAGLLAADLEVRLGDMQIAEQHYDSLRHDLQADDRLLFLAVERYAYLREAQGDLDGALAALGELSTTHKHFYADRATLHRARLHEAKGDAPGAIALLESMQQDFPRTSLGEEIGLRLEALAEAKAQRPATGDDLVPGRKDPP